MDFYIGDVLKTKVHHGWYSVSFGDEVEVLIIGTSTKYYPQIQYIVTEISSPIKMDTGGIIYSERIFDDFVNSDYTNIDKSSKIFFGKRIDHLYDKYLSKIEKSIGGQKCKKCKEYFDYAEPNQQDKTFLCYICRTYYCY